MATTFPSQIVTFDTMIDIDSSDAPKVAQFIQYMNNGDIANASAVLATIPNYDQKLWTAELANTVTDTCIAVQQYFLQRYTNGYVVSATQPTSQDVGDFWFKVVS